MPTDPAVETALWGLWDVCLESAENLNRANVPAVCNLLKIIRDVHAEFGAEPWESDLLVAAFHTVVHWDKPHPTARFFEAALEYDLRFYLARLIPTKGTVN